MKATSRRTFSDEFHMPSDFSGPGVAGMAFDLKHFRSPPAPSVFVNRGGNSSVLAHEIGHVLLDSWSHLLYGADDPDNLMHDAGGNGKDRLTPEQIRVMRSNKLGH